MLTEEQLEYFECFGFLHLRKAFSHAEIEQITELAEETWEKVLGRRLQGEEDAGVNRFVERSARLTELVTDSRIYEPVRQLLGDNFLWQGSEGNRGVPPNLKVHNWHADRPGAKEAEYRRLKIMLYLDPTTKETGAFRVIPGSHRPGFNDSLSEFTSRHSEERPTFFGLEGADVPCHAAESNPGDIVMFHYSLYHAVYGKTGPRRYIALKYVSAPQNDEQLLSLQRWSQYVFEPDEAFRNSKDERIRRMVAGTDELAARVAELAPETVA